jgi:hypothetical protein
MISNQGQLAWPSITICGAGLVQNHLRLDLLEFGARSPSAPLSVLIVLVASRMARWRRKLSRLSSRAAAFCRKRAPGPSGWSACRLDRLDRACRRRSAISVRRNSRSALPSWSCRARQRTGSSGRLPAWRSARSIRERARCARTHWAAESLTEPKCPGCSLPTPVSRAPSDHAARCVPVSFTLTASRCMVRA